MQLANPLAQFFDLAGDPLQGGSIYVGQPNTNPVTNPVTVYADQAMTIPLPQPLKTTNGTPSLSGTPVGIYVGQASVAILVLDSRGRTVLQAPQAMTGIGSLGSLPTALPSQSGVLWNNGGVLCIS